MKELIITIVFTLIMIASLFYINNAEKRIDNRTEEQKCIQEYSNTTIRNTPNYCIKYFK